MSEPCKLRVLLQDGNARFLGDREFEDFVEKSLRIALDLNHLPALPRDRIT
jgi:hypothetical protein